jgi:multidrug efflux system membrane fusion protein
VPVSQPIERQVTDFVDFTGRTDAVQSVDVRARVTGYLVQMPFKEGTEVKKGDLLFEIDPRPYQAQLDQAQSQVALTQAQLLLAKTTLARDRRVNIDVPGSISAQQLDQDQAAVDEATARVKAAQAATEAYRLNLEFTRVTSPIDGMVSRYYLTLGNLVNQDQTLLTTVVSLDPMYAYFDMDEATLLNVRRAIKEGRIKVPKDRADIPIYMALHGEQGFPHRGTFNFINNVVNPSTGTILVRASFDNPTISGRVRLLTPGMFVRIRLPIGEPHRALLVVDRALGSDQGIRFVYVVDSQNKIQYRRVTPGPLQDDGLRVIEEGVTKDDWVVVGALQRVRPRMEVRPDQVAMPIPGTPATGKAPEPVPDRPQPPPPGKEKKSDK